MYVMDQPGKVATPDRGQLNRENESLIFPCPLTCLRIWSRETGLLAGFLPFSAAAPVVLFI